MVKTREKVIITITCEAWAMIDEATDGELTVGEIIEVIKIKDFDSTDFDIV